MVKSIKYHLSNEFRKLRLLKRMKKNEPDKTEPDTIVGAADPVGTTDPVGTSGCTATPDWCTVAGYDTYPASFPSFNSVCDICADSFHPISCRDAGMGESYSSTIQLLKGGAQGSYTVNFLRGASGEARMTFQGQPYWAEGGFVFDNDDNASGDSGASGPGNTSYSGPSPQERWQSGRLPFPVQDKIAIYYRLLPDQTQENPNGEWFLDQWSDGTTAQAPTSCICKEPTQLVADDNYKYSLTANSTVHQFYVENPNNTGDNDDNPPVSFYVTFDGTYVNVFTSNLTTLTANTPGQVIYPTGPNGYGLKVTSLDDTTAEFEFLPPT